jgi:hypothetical protein
MSRPIPRSHYRLTEPGVDHYRSFDEPVKVVRDRHDLSTSVFWFCILSATFAFWYFVAQLIRGAL